jgi:hypothetical protein
MNARKFALVSIAAACSLAFSMQASAGWLKSGAKLFAKTIIIGAGVTLGAHAAADIYKSMTTADKKGLRATCLAEAGFFKNNPAVCKIAIEEGK